MNKKNNHVHFKITEITPKLLKRNIESIENILKDMEISLYCSDLKEG